LGKIILKTNSIRKSYSNGNSNLIVLDDLSLIVKEREIITIMGQSGSGKSTLLNILGTLDKPDSGSIEVAGMIIDDMNEDLLSNLRNSSIGFVFQFHHLLSEFTALENVLIPTWIKNTNDRNKKPEAIALFKQLNMFDRLNHLPNQLSGGERSRVALIRAIINRPLILLADEPTGNLDKKNSIKLIDLLIQINKDFNQTIILTTHNPDVAAIGHKRYMLENGLLQIID
tara:strand:- start:839 stop:1522 length:684 start_codon:yes stop_codon:yes gene_type:complete